MDLGSQRSGWAALCGILVLRSIAALADEPFRPAPGAFPPLEKAHTYQGELAFVDHANRRGSLRVQGHGVFRSTEPNPFAMLPYGMVRLHGAPADLRDIPLGTVLHVTAYLPPEPQFSSVPVLPVDNKERDANHRRGVGVFPAENHALLVEDEASHCQRTGRNWKLTEVSISEGQGTLVASLETAGEQTFGFDPSTRVWRGRERLTIAELIAEGSWPAEGRKSLGGRPVRLNLTWRPTPGGVFLRYHVADLWLDDASFALATAGQTAQHVAFMRSRWLPGRVDSVAYGKFGRARIAVTLFGGMDPSLYADFVVGAPALMNGVENTLKHTEAGSAGPSQMAVRGPIREVARLPGTPPPGSSGIRVTMETDLVTEGVRPGKNVRLRPASWPDVHLPREEYIDGHAGRLDERFPTPAIFPRY
ncbi:MAG: hypothetical protein ACO3ND_03650 [Opitutales bacterium]